MKLEEEKEQENFIDYVEAYFQLTPSDEQKGVIVYWIVMKNKSSELARLD